MRGGTARTFNLAALTDAKVMSLMPVYNRDSSVLAEIWQQRFEDQQWRLTSALANLPNSSGEFFRFRPAFGATRDASPGHAEPAGPAPSASAPTVKPGSIEQTEYSENGRDVAGLLVTDPHLKVLLGQDPDRVVSLATYLEHPFLPHTGQQVVWLATWLIAGCLGASWLARSVLRRLRPTRCLSDATGPRLFVLARPGESALASSEVSRLDLSALADEVTNDTPAWATSRTLPASGTVVLDGLEYLHGDPVIDERKLRVLETLLAVPDLAVVVLSRIEPLRAFGATPAGSGKRLDGADCATGDPTSRRRWLDVMSRLVMGAVQTTEEAAGGLEWLLGSAVARVARELEAGRPGFADRDAAFLHEWSGLARPEKLVLVQLADEGLVNHRRADVVFDLVDRGILIANPTIRFRHRNLRDLVLCAASVDRVREWETTNRRGAMTALEMPIALGLGLLAVFLYLTQRDLYITITSLAGAAASAAPWMTRMAATFSGTRLARAPLGSGAPTV
jgi:hypothetical protein